MNPATAIYRKLAGMMNILIVEDNDRTRQLIKSLVADLAAQIYECGDGAAAIAAYAAHRPDWVLMDIRMPGVNGLTATRQITAAWPDAKIMIVTNCDDAETHEAARNAGAAEFVVKEDLQEIRRILLQALS